MVRGGTRDAYRRKLTCLARSYVRWRVGPRITLLQLCATSLLDLIRILSKRFDKHLVRCRNSPLVFGQHGQIMNLLRVVR